MGGPPSTQGGTSRSGSRAPSPAPSVDSVVPPEAAEPVIAGENPYFTRLASRRDLLPPRSGTPSIPAPTVNAPPPPPPVDPATAAARAFTPHPANPGQKLRAMASYKKGASSGGRSSKEGEPSFGASALSPPGSPGPARATWPTEPALTGAALDADEAACTAASTLATKIEEAPSLAETTLCVVVTPSDGGAPVTLKIKVHLGAPSAAGGEGAVAVMRPPSALGGDSASAPVRRVLTKRYRWYDIWTPLLCGLVDVE